MMEIEEEISIPPEIWQHILSFNTLPYGRGLCASITSMENDLIPARLQYMYERYRGDIHLAITSDDWDACLLMCKYMENFHTSNLMMSIYSCLRKCMYSIAGRLHTKYRSVLCANDIYGVILVCLVQAGDLQGMDWLIQKNVVDTLEALRLIVTHSRIDQCETYLISRRNVFGFANIIYMFADQAHTHMVRVLLRHTKMSNYHIPKRECPHRYDSDEALCYNMIDEHIRRSSYYL